MPESGKKTTTVATENSNSQVNTVPVQNQSAPDKSADNNTTQNHYLEFNGEKHNLAEWAEIVGLSKKCLSERIRRGWTVERALTTKTIRVDNFGNYMKEWNKSHDN